MLQSIRDKTQGWIAGIIISLLILSFALWGIHSYFMGGAVSTVVAEVDGTEITKGQLAIAYERLRRQVQSQLNSNDELSANTDAGLKDRALQALINIQVLKQASIQQNYYISPLQVDGYLENMPEFQVNNQFSLARFQQALATTMYTPVEFLELIKTSLLIDQPRLGTIFSSFALPNEVDETIALINQERDIIYTVFTNQYFSKANVVVSEEMKKKYYEQHQDEFKTPEQVSVEYLELSTKDLLNKVKVTDADLKTFYNENTNAFAEPVRRKLEMLTVPVASTASPEQIAKAKDLIDQIYEKAKKGVSFDVLQKSNLPSYVTVSAAKWMTQNEIPGVLQKSVLMLTQPGQISAPVKVTDSSFAIVKVIEFKEAQLTSFDNVKDKVKELYTHQKAQELFAEEREKLANLTYQHPESLEVASKELGLPIKETELFAIDKGSNEITANNKVREAAFSNEVLTLQNNSDVIQKNADSAIVIRIKSHVPSSLLSLKAVQQQIADKLRVAEINAKAQKEIRDMSEKLNEGSNPQEILKPYNVSWTQVGFIARHSTKVDTAILDTAFEMPKPTDDHKVTYEVAKVPNGYAIVGLKNVKNGKSTGTEEYEVYAEQAQNTQGLLEYGLYKLSAMNNAKIVNK